MYLKPIISMKYVSSVQLFENIKNNSFRFFNTSASTCSGKALFKLLFQNVVIYNLTQKPGAFENWLLCHM